MPQSLAKNLLHLIFSTKDRRPLLEDGIREEIHRYACGILKDLESPVLAINSVADHIHVLFNLHRTKSLADVVMELKRGTSKWIKTKGQQFVDFQWQSGYGAFSVSQSAVVEVIDYIRDQAEHHRKITFQDEFRRFLQRYEIEFDERYVWD
jgi:REP element-mobilizing transposase RayT